MSYKNVSGSPMDYSKISDIVIGGIDLGDYPECCDAHIVEATYCGEPMGEGLIEDLDPDFVYQSVVDAIHC